jgi:hypothetical protein
MEIVYVLLFAINWPQWAVLCWLVGGEPLASLSAGNKKRHDAEPAIVPFSRILRIFRKPNPTCDLSAV